jgi:nucleoside-diphosphate-sugar epimerase
MRILITGACGGVARAVIAALAPEHSLLLLDRVSPAEATVFAGDAGRTHLPLETEWPFIQAEITDPDALVRAMAGIDGVVHLAGHPTGLPEEGPDIFHTNALGTFVVLDAVRRADVQRVLCASSINAFGTFYWRLSGNPAPYTSMPLTEEFQPVPEDPYSISKLVTGEICGAFSRAYGITAVALRFAGVYTHQHYEATLAAGLKPTEQWDEDLYQWVHVEDVAAGIRLALEQPDLSSFGVYTLSAADTRCPEPTMEILRRFRPDLASTVNRPLEGRAPLLSIDRARETFGYAPRYRLCPDRV